MELEHNGETYIVPDTLLAKIDFPNGRNRFGNDIMVHREVYFSLFYIHLEEWLRDRGIEIFPSYDRKGYFSEYNRVADKHKINIYSYELNKITGFLSENKFEAMVQVACEVEPMGK
jgi:hypothetical protein